MSPCPQRAYNLKSEIRKNDREVRKDRSGGSAIERNIHIPDSSCRGEEELRGYVKVFTFFLGYASSGKHSHMQKMFCIPC